MARNLQWRCGFGGTRKPNGNCEVPDQRDGAAVQGVGAWTPEKHHWLGRFIDATWAARARFLGPRKGGAAYVDLYSGPGRIRVEGERQDHDGSPLLALAHEKAPFSRIVLCDLEEENIHALRQRTAPDAHRTTIMQGDCNEMVGEITAAIPGHGLNLAFVDPFGPSVLHWRTLAALGAFSRMDMLVNVPIGFIKRNFHQESFHARLDAMLGYQGWRDEIGSAADATKIIELLRTRLAPLGYLPDRCRSHPITNSSNVPMFYMAFFSKHGLGDRIWTSLSRVEPSGQTGFGFD